MRIPEVRKELAWTAAELIGIGNRMRYLVGQMYRRPALKRAPVTSRKLTRALAAEIRAYVKVHPRMSNKKIGLHFGVDGGRVTDAVRGKRT